MYLAKQEQKHSLLSHWESGGVRSAKHMYIPPHRHAKELKENEAVLQTASAFISKVDWIKKWQGTVAALVFSSTSNRARGDFPAEEVTRLYLSIAIGWLCSKIQMATQLHSNYTCEQSCFGWLCKKHIQTYKYTDRVQTFSTKKQTKKTPNTLVPTSIWTNVLLFLCGTEAN